MTTQCAIYSLFEPINSDDDIPQEMMTGAHSAPLITLAVFAGMFVVQPCKELEEHRCKND